MSNSNIFFFSEVSNSIRHPKTEIKSAFKCLFSLIDVYDYSLEEAVLTITHNLCFRSKIKKIGIPIYPVLHYKSGIIHYTVLLSRWNFVVTPDETYSYMLWPEEKLSV